ncbi:Phosphatidylinositol 4-phosphate 5-kinase 2 isoform A [Chlorella sorokiniana]|uniref:1-phosphatidylinositol-4-phosphate 5-kinase n=1 Tax=Chlorella sorokiniana TaxID=3076 RepID=A0A2P6TDV9_CHLSO|nr:Phosphatidylinositol 4-phosphate 5-kinase 2 isoform A [Chlorella sorokiniana]|eukprot:PRW20830.1 Phosphatidylinositol 4-phosphate 5-kinase 2 isoform A [Chlorella sorokiniana]
MAEPATCAGAPVAAPSSTLLLLTAAGLALGVLVVAALVTWRLQCRPAATAAAAAALAAKAQAAALPPGLPLPPSTPDPSLPQPLPAAQAAEAAAAIARASPATPAPPPQQQAALPPPLAPPALPRKLVRATLPDGEHHVQFGDGSAYYGEWRGGRMHGRGVFVWPTGERYEGEWSDGQECGTAMFTGAEGGTYYGSWVGGQMHGECVYRPAGADTAGPQVVYLQQYDHGRLVSQQVLRVAEKDIRKRQQKKEGKKKVKREAKQQYRAPKPGEPVYKGHRSYDLMRELQLGITFSIAQAGLAAANGELRESDFSEETTQHFPPGSETAPFKWKDYAPRVFHRLRQSFGIDNTDYLLSLTGEAALRLLGSPGKSGSVFFLSDDDRFLVKTVRHSEMRLLLSLIPLYYRHVQANPGTLLTRFYGVHRLTPIIGRQVRFVVMGNVLPSDLRLHRKFDLKGSTYGRTVGADVRATHPYATLKDEDLDMQLILPQEQYGGVLRQLRRDLDLLQRLHVIDYSLLLGVHFARWGDAGWHPPFRDWPAVAGGADSLGGELWARQPSLPTAPAADDEAQCVLLGSGSLASGGRALDPGVAAQLGRLLSGRRGGEHESAGRAVPAVAVRRTANGALQYEPVLLFFGIIDFLQDYTMRKHLERWWKAAIHDGGAVSVADPRFYGRRFWHAMQRLLLSSSAAPAPAAGHEGADSEAPSPFPPPLALAALAKRRPGRPSAFVTPDGNPACQCCGTDLTKGGHKSFHQRYHICEQHMMAQSVERKGTLQRFCQQCGRFHELEAFDPGMRSCRQQLARHAERRRRARAAASAAQASHGHRGPSASSDSVALAALGGPDLLAAVAGGMPDAYMPRATTKRQLSRQDGERYSPDLEGAPTGRLPGSSGSSASAHSGMAALDALVAAAEEEQQNEAAAKRQRTGTPPAVVEPDPSWFLPQPSATATALPSASAAMAAAMQPREAQASSLGLPPPSMLLAGLPLAPPAALAAQQADMQLLLRHLVAPPPPVVPVPAPLALLASPPAAMATAVALQQQQQQQQVLQQQLAVLAAAGDPVAAAALQAAAVQRQAADAQQQAAAAAAQRLAQEAHLRRLLLEQERRAAAVHEVQAACLFQAACDAILGSRYRVCPEHATADVVLNKGVPSRFCQQCGRFHPLEAFEPSLRSCRQQLARHAARRRERRRQAAAAKAGARPEGEPAAAAPQQAGDGQQKRRRQQPAQQEPQAAQQQQKQQQEAQQLTPRQLSDPAALPSEAADGAAVCEDVAAGPQQPATWEAASRPLRSVAAVPQLASSPPPPRAIAQSPAMLLPGMLQLVAASAPPPVTLPPTCLPLATGPAASFAPSQPPLGSVAVGLQRAAAQELIARVQQPQRDFDVECLLLRLAAMSPADCEVQLAQLLAGTAGSPFV